MASRMWTPTPLPPSPFPLAHFRPKVGIHRLGLLGAGVRIAWMGASHLRSGGVW
jgi:hypothetical protein